MDHEWFYFPGCFIKYLARFLGVKYSSLHGNKLPPSNTQYGGIHIPSTTAVHGIRKTLGIESYSLRVHQHNIFIQFRFRFSLDVDVKPDFGGSLYPEGNIIRRLFSHSFSYMSYLTISTMYQRSGLTFPLESHLFVINEPPSHHQLM